MKLNELFEEARKIWAKKVENPEDVKEISLNNTEKQYKVKDVIFDNVNGLGQVPNNQNVRYAGLTVIMKVDDFLNIAADAGEQRNETAAGLKELIDQGYGIATPWLVIDIDKIKSGKPGYAVCTGHEGRARAVCAKKYFGITEFPVHVFFPGYRNRDISPEVIEKMQEGIKREISGSVVRNAFKKVIG